MSQATTLVLLPSTTFSGPSVMSKVGDPQKAASYDVAWRDIQTISWSASKSFDGTAKIQVSLAEAPTVFDWVDMYTLPTTAETLPGNQSGYYNLQGSYVWVRVNVTNWTVGTINAITMSY